MRSIQLPSQKSVDFCEGNWIERIFQKCAQSNYPHKSLLTSPAYPTLNEIANNILNLREKLYQFQLE